jgi:hypothetical protein
MIDVTYKYWESQRSRQPQQFSHNPPFERMIEGSQPMVLQKQPDEGAGEEGVMTIEVTMLILTNSLGIRNLLFEPCKIEGLG